jgi:hypothetical protein
MSYQHIGALLPSDGANFGVDGFACIRQVNTLAHKQRVAEAARLWLDTLGGRTDPIFLRQAFVPSHPVLFEALNRQYPALFPVGMRETMTTSDFDMLTVDTLDRILQGTFAGLPTMWKGLVKLRPLRDFRTVSRKAVDGMRGRWSAVAESAPHPTQSISEVTPVTYAPSKYASGSEAVSWEAMMNDELGIFKDIVDRLALGGMRTLEYFVTSMFVDSNGPHASLYTVNNANIINTTNGAVNTNPALGIAGLEDGFTVLYKKVDSGGDPIATVGKIYLWYGPNNVIAVEQLMAAITSRTTVQGGSTSQELEVRNWWSSRLTPVMLPYLNQIVGANEGSWGLVADPNSQPRPAVEIGTLPGYDTPVMLQKAPNTMRGGALASEFGDFNTLSGNEFKGLMVFGGAQISGVSTVASNGTGA